MIATSSICQCACGLCSVECGGYAGVADRYRRCCHSGYARAIQRSTKHVSGVHDRAPNAWSTSILMMARDNLSNVQQVLSLSAKRKSQIRRQPPPSGHPMWSTVIFKQHHITFARAVASPTCITVPVISSRKTCRARSLGEKLQEFVVESDSTATYFPLTKPCVGIVLGPGDGIV